MMSENCSGELANVCFTWVKLKGHFRVTLCFCFKTRPSYENEIYLHEKEVAGEIHFHQEPITRPEPPYVL